MTTKAATVPEAKRHPTRVPFALDVPVTKAVVADAQSGDLSLEGYANTHIEDRDFEVIAPGAFDKSLKQYLEKNPILLWQHNPDWPIGQVKDGRTDDTGLWVNAIVRRELCLADGVDSELHVAYHAIKTGTVRAFSIGGWFEREFVDNVDGGPIIVVTAVELWEISVVSVPANPDSVFEAVVKAANGDRTARVSDSMSAQMMQLLGAEPVTDPFLAQLEGEQRTRYYGTLAALYRKAGVQPPGRRAWTHITEQLERGTSQDELLPEIMQFLASAKGLAIPGGPDGKAGRALSAANESKLRKAVEKHEDAATMLADATESVKGVLAAVEAAADDEEAAPVKCSECGAYNKPDAVECTSCGKPMKSAAATPKRPGVDRAVASMKAALRATKQTAPEGFGDQVEALGNIVEAMEGVLETLGWTDPDEPDAGEPAEDDTDMPTVEDYADAVEQLGNLVEAAEAVLELLGWEDPDEPDAETEDA